MRIIVIVALLLAAAMWIGAKAGHLLDRNLKPLHRDLIAQQIPP